MSNLNIPLIRFTQYSDSWNLRPLSELIASVDSGWSPQCDDGSASMGEWGVLKTTSIQWTGFEPNQNKKLPNALEPRAKLSLSKNDILVTRAGPNERVGVVSIVNQDYPMLMLSDKIIRLRANAEVDPRYLALNLSLKKSNYQIMRKASGLATSQTNISQGFLLQTKLNVPELPEQQKIASFLSKVDEKITLLTEKKDKLTEYKKGVMQQLFSGKWEEQDGQLTFIPPTLRFKADDGSDFPDWEEKQLGDVATFSKGKGISKADILEDGITPCVRYGELYTTYNEVIDEVKSKTNLPVDALVLSHANDVIIPSSGETALDIATASCVESAGIALSGDLTIIRSKMNGAFLSFQLNTVKKFELAALAQGASVIHLYAAHLKRLKVSIPQIEEQTKIVNFLSAIDQKIDLTTSELEKAKEWKQGLLQQMFV